MNTQTRTSIIARLKVHLSGDGTLNDGKTDALYREWHGIADEFETELEWVEQWAVDLLNGGQS